MIIIIIITIITIIIITIIIVIIIKIIIIIIIIKQLLAKVISNSYFSQGFNLLFRNSYFERIPWIAAPA